MNMEYSDASFTRLLGSLTLVAITAVALLGMGLVSRVQMGLLALLIVSQVKKKAFFLVCEQGN